MPSKIEKTIGPAKGTTTSRASQTKNLFAAWEKLPAGKDAYKLAFEKIAEDINLDGDPYSYPTLPGDSSRPIKPTSSVLGDIGVATGVSARNPWVAGANILGGQLGSIIGSRFEKAEPAPFQRVIDAQSKLVRKGLTPALSDDQAAINRYYADINKTNVMDELPSKSWWETAKELPAQLIPSLIARRAVTRRVPITKAVGSAAGLGAGLSAAGDVVADAVAPGEQKLNLANAANTAVDFAAPTAVGAGTALLRGGNALPGVAGRLGRTPLTAAATGLLTQGINTARYYAASPEEKQAIANETLINALRQRSRIDKSPVLGRLGVAADLATAALGGGVHDVDAANAALFAGDTLADTRQSINETARLAASQNLKRVLKDKTLYEDAIRGKK
jgi:hypothetical protein